MRMPRARFTVGRMMVAVAIVGSASGVLIERQRRFDRLAKEHLKEYWKYVPEDELRPRVPNSVADWHLVMYCNYEFASRRPWLPVEVEADPRTPR
jgi:hypothetical protein